MSGRTDAEPRTPRHPIGPGERERSRPCCLCGEPTVGNPYLCPAHAADSARRAAESLADVAAMRAARSAAEGDAS